MMFANFTEKQFYNMFNRFNEYFDNNDNEFLEINSYGWHVLFDYKHSKDTYFNTVATIDLLDSQAIEVQDNNYVYHILFSKDDLEYNRCYRFDKYDSDFELDISIKTFRKHFNKVFKKLKNRADYLSILNIFNS